MPAVRRAAAPAGPPQEGQAAAPPRAAMPMVPFDQAAHRGIEQGPTFTGTLGTTQTTHGPVPIPAQGFLRRILLDVICAGGVGGTGGGDYPWNMINLVRLGETNGAPLIELSGFNLMLLNTYGGYAGSPDPRVDPDFSATAPNVSFTLSVPVEIAPTGLGSLSNESASAAYRITVIMDTLANVFSVAPGTPPNYTIRVFTDFWTAPGPTDALGRAQQQVPPYHGTAQYGTQQQNNSVNTGANTSRITRVGDLIRLLAVVSRISGARSDSPFPDPLTLNWNHRDLIIATQRILRKIMREQIEGLTVRDVGVHVLNFSYGEGRHAGDNAVNSWLATVSATRFDLVGNSAAAGTLDFIVNDVSVAAVAPAQRVLEQSTGYTPPAGAALVGQT